MLFFYLAFLFVGGVLHGISMIGGGDGDGDSFEADHSLEINGTPELETGMDTEMETEIEADAELEVEHEISVHTSAEHVNAADAVKLFSFRNMIYFSAFFGLTGTVFNLIDFYPFMTFVFALLMGLFSWTFGYKLMKYLKSSQSGEAVNSLSLVGRTAKGTLSVGKGKKGKIVVQTGVGTMELVAQCSDISAGDLIDRGQEVLIFDYKNNVYYVTENDIS